MICGAAIVATPCRCRWLVDSYKSCGSSETQHQVVIFKIHFALCETAGFQEFIFPDEHHSRTDKTVAIARGEVVTEDLNARFRKFCGGKFRRTCESK